MSAPPTLRARISRSALAANAQQAFAKAGQDAVADLRRDAFGHGVAVVAAALVAAGVRHVLIDEAGHAAAAAAGVDAAAIGPTLDTAHLYGFPGAGGVPVMRLSGTVLSTKRLLAGEGVSYGYTHRAARDTNIALVSGGYGQGVIRGVGDRVFVEVGERRCPLIGRVAMDVSVVDIGDAWVGPGDEVVFFGGDGLARDALAAWQDATSLTFAEIACAAGLRANREDVA